MGPAGPATGESKGPAGAEDDLEEQLLARYAKDLLLYLLYCPKTSAPMDEIEKNVLWPKSVSKARK